jgi:hypothetical protein
MTNTNRKPPNQLGKMMDHLQAKGSLPATATLGSYWWIAIVWSILGFTILMSQGETPSLWKTILGWYLLGFGGLYLIVYYFDQFVPTKNDDSDTRSP